MSGDSEPSMRQQGVEQARLMQDFARRLAENLHRITIVTHIDRRDMIDPGDQTL